MSRLRRYSVDSTDDYGQDKLVGGRLRRLRETRGISMRALARMSGLSANALSMIERGRTSPSVSTLYKLAEAMGLPITAFFRQEAKQEAIVYRKADGRSLIPFTGGVWQGLGGESFVGRVEPFLLELEPAAHSGVETLIHTGHEFVMCLEGVLVYDVEGQRFELLPGDSLLFAARLGHRWHNPGDTITRAVFVLSGFESYERPGEFHFSEP